MRARRLLDSCILASTVTLREPISLLNSSCLPGWIKPLSRERVEALLGASAPAAR